MEINHESLWPLLDIYYEKRQPVMLKGATGIGKSIAVNEFFRDKSEKIGRKFVEWNKLSEADKISYLKEEKKRGETLLFVDERINLKDNTDNKGIPQLQGTEYLKWMKTLIINVAAKENAAVIFFKDEFNQACFPKGTKVSTENGLKRIEDIREKDRVLNQHGQYEHVEQVMDRAYEGNLIRLNIRNLVPFECTEDHPLLTCRRIKHKKEDRNEEFSKLEWKKASEIKTDDFIASPILKADIDVDYIDLTKYQTSMPLSVDMRIKLSEELCWLFGLYVAEGYNHNKRFGLCLGTHEKKLISKTKEVIKRVLGYAPQQVERDSSTTIRFSSPILANAFSDWFGKGAKNKRIPDFILRNKNKKYLTSFIRGYFEGDGSFPNQVRVSFGTASEELAFQLQLAFTRYGILPAINKWTTKEGTVIEKGKKRIIVGGKTVYSINTHQNEAYDVVDVRGKEKQRKNRYHYIHEGQIISKIHKIGRRKFSGKVYNFETGLSHTYIVNNTVVHNCPSVMNSEFQWILDKAIDDISFAEGVYTIAAGNRLEDKAQISEMSGPLKNRFAHLTLMSPNIEVWADWAIKNGGDSRVVAFLHFRESYLFTFKQDLKEDAFATPRSWMALSELIKDVENIQIVKQLSQSIVGDGVGHEFAKFVELEMKINLDEYLKDPKKLEKIAPNKLDIKHAILSSAIERYRKKPEILPKAACFIKYLPPQFSIYFLKMLRMSNEKYFRAYIIKTDVWEEIRDNYGKYLLDE